MRDLLAPILAAVALAVAACGGDDETARTVAPLPAPAPAGGPPPTSPETQTATQDAATAPKPPASPPVATTGTPRPESPRQSGDEEGNAVPASLHVADKRVQPASLEVPAFLQIDLTVIAADGRAHVLRIALPKGPLEIRVPPGGRTRVTLSGMRPGEYPVAADGAAPTSRLRVTGGG